MGTWHLPGGHRITDVPELPEEFTPTLEEWFWSMVYPPNFLRMYVDKSGETTFYFAVNTTISAAALWYHAGQSLSAYRTLSAFSFIASVPGAAILLSTSAGYGYVRTSDVHGGVVPGVTTMGGVGPGYYQNTSDPMGKFEEGVRGFFAILGF